MAPVLQRLADSMLGIAQLVNLPTNNPTDSYAGKKLIAGPAYGHLTPELCPTNAAQTLHDVLNFTTRR